MICAKCGNTLSNKDRFCPKCGMAREVINSPERPNRKPFYIAIAALALVVILALLFALLAKPGKVTNAPVGVDTGGKIVSAPSGTDQSGNVVLAPPALNPPSDTTPASIKKPKPSQELLNYLKVIKNIEEVRKEFIVSSSIEVINAQVMAAVMGSMTEDEPEKTNLGKLDIIQRKLIIALQYFDKNPAPPEARAFSGSYRKMLYTEATTLNTINSGLRKALSGDMSGLEDLGNYLKGLTQNEDIKAASNGDMSDDVNKQLDLMVSNYDMVKPFSIASEKGGKSLLTP